jgi:hypothetical protein
MKFTGRNRTMTDEEICQMYLECRDSETVAYHAKCSGTTVLSIARRNGIEVNRRGGKRKPLPVSDAEVCRRYLSGQSGITIATDLGVSYPLVYKILEKHNIERRRKWHHLGKANPHTSKKD